MIADEQTPITELPERETEKTMSLADLSLSPSANAWNWANFMRKGKHNKARSQRAFHRIANRKAKR